jgi:hypothetical protein
MRREKGDFSPHSPGNIAPLPTDTSAIDMPREQITLESLLDGWAAEKGPAEKTIYSWRRFLSS